MRLGKARQHPQASAAPAICQVISSLPQGVSMRSAITACPVFGPQPRRLTIEVTLGGNGKRRRNRRANHEAEQDFDQAERHERGKRR